jgi:hypothetical protein
MLSKEQKDERSVATDDDSSTEAGHTIKKTLTRELHFVFFTFAAP